MNRLLHFLVFATGLAAVGWIGAGYVGSHLLALSVTVLVAIVYLAGAWELYRSRRAALTLRQALSELPEPPPDLDAWLSRLHPSLRNAVRLRIEGVRVALPGPSLTPYFVGLLVLLGMLGTFLGMVATLRGTGFALESATDLQAIRASLAAPVKGLGFAFGTSIAGVAASAMLGLLSALHRADLAVIARELDSRISTTLRRYSLAHQREESFRLMQRQSELLPAVVERMQSMAEAMERHAQSLNERLLAGQAQLHEKTETSYAKLAQALEHSLKESLVEGAQALNAAVQPAVEATMAGLAREADALHGTVLQAMERQLKGMSTSFEATTAAAADAWKSAVGGQQAANESLSAELRLAFDGVAQGFEQRAATLLEDVAIRLDGAATAMSESWSGALSRQEDAWNRSRSDLLQAVAEQDEQRLKAWTGALEHTAAELGREWEATSARAASLQRDIGESLALTASTISADAQAQAGRTIAQIEQLVQTASEAPRAATEVVVEARRMLSESAARDNDMLKERNRMLAALDSLLAAVSDASTGQRDAVDTLLSRSAEVLERVSANFTQRIESETGKLTGVATALTGAGSEVAALGEAFGGAVRQFSESNAALMERLNGIETALDKSMARSDEQLAYYVAQAREVVDLSILSQKQIIEELQSLAEQRASAASSAS